MQTQPEIRQTIVRQLAWSVLIYALPVLLMFVALYWTGQRPWNAVTAPLSQTPAHVHSLSAVLRKYWLTLLVLALGVVEFSFGLYEARWTKNERLTDIVCFAAPHLITGPAIALFSTRALPFLLPGLHNRFAWVPFIWGFLIICIGDDLTQYWYHRLHHQIPWLWRFHRTHHSAPYMGMAMASRQNLWYTIFFSQIYVTAALVYLGLGASAAVALVIKSLITTLAHSSIPWDMPFYKCKVLHPAAWVLERLISTPATHHAHHADTASDGVGYYKGNFGNMFFLWDVMFGTAHISRQYPKSFGISHYAGDPWYAQFLWPVLKSNVANSELAPNGPVVKEDPPAQAAEYVPNKFGPASVRL
jgi:sterol desaturase/sphingolipid hydroxylase (fatty acid hydroxylase superfamily)